MNSPALVLLPALGASPRMYRHQLDAIPGLVVPEWIPPLAGESLARYAQRMAATIAPLKPGWIGGTSFGGMVALEMTRHLPVKGCFLISGIRTADELPVWMQRNKRWLHGFPAATDRLIAWTAFVLSYSVGWFLPLPYRRVLYHLRKLQCPWAKWACLAIHEWKPDATWPCPVWQIHGSRDVVLPAERTTPDEIVPGGFHLLPMSHPEEINAFIALKTGMKILPLVK